MAIYLDGDFELTDKHTINITADSVVEYISTIRALLDMDNMFDQLDNEEEDEPVE